MPLKPEEARSLFNKALASGTDTAALSDTLATLTEEMTNLYAERDDYASKTAKLAADNENLRATNMKLFLKVGQKGALEDPALPKQPDEEEKLSFDALFNGKGGLK